DGQAVTIEDFLACFEAVTQRDLGQFALWYHQAGTPRVAVTTSYDAARQEYSLNIQQSVAPTPTEAFKKPMHIPLAFGLVGADGTDMMTSEVEGAEVKAGVLHLTQQSQTVCFREIAEHPVLSINRGFSAPIILDRETT